MDLRLCVDKIVVWAIRVMDLVSRGVITTFSSVRGARDGATQKIIAWIHAGPRGRRLMLDCGMPVHVDGHP